MSPCHGPLLDSDRVCSIGCCFVHRTWLVWTPQIRGPMGADFGALVDQFCGLGPCLIPWSTVDDRNPASSYTCIYVLYYHISYGFGLQGLYEVTLGFYISGPKVSTHPTGRKIERFCGVAEGPKCCLP